MIVTAHQPNYLPGLSVVEKVRASDAVIWLDEVQYSRDGFTNRNRMPDGSWLTVPVERATHFAPMNRVRVSEHGNWRAKHLRTLWQHYGAAAAPLAAELERPHRRLVGLNLAMLRVLLSDQDFSRWHFQSHLDGGPPVVAVSDDPDELGPISQRLALMVARVGGTTYLSGPSGRRYLDEGPFADAGIRVEYFEWAGANPCSAQTLDHVNA